MDRTVSINFPIEEIPSFVKHMRKEVIGVLKFPHNEGVTYQHEDGCYYSADFNSLSTIIIDIVGGITSIISLITAIVLYLKEKKGTAKEKSKITLTYKKTTFEINSGTIVEEIIEKIVHLDNEK